MANKIKLDIPTAREAFPEEWPEWVLQCLERLSEAENAGGCTFFDGADEWTENMLVESVKTMLPNIRWAKDAQSGPEFLGAIVGHQQHLLESPEVEKAMEQNLEKISTGSEKFYESLRQQLSKDEYEKLMEDIERDSTPFRELLEFFEKTVEQKMDVLKDCVCIAQAQPFEERIQFSTAYSKALNTPLFDEQGEIKHQTLTTKIYTIMVLCWRKVQGMKTLRQVYEWLKKLLG